MVVPNLLMVTPVAEVDPKRTAVTVLKPEPLMVTLVFPDAGP
jgi:hypothetical protein